MKYVIPNMEKTFGELRFGGEIVESNQLNVRRGRRNVNVARRYSLFSDIQRADNIEVTLSSKAGVKKFEYEERVVLINPRITVVGNNANGNNYVSYELLADDMESLEKTQEVK